MRRSTCSSAAAQASRPAAGRGGFFAGDAQRPALVGVVDVPDPGERGLAALDQRRDIAAHPVGRGADARHHGDLPRAGLVVEVGNQLAEHVGRRAVDRFERDGRAGRRAAGQRRARRPTATTNSRRRWPPALRPQARRSDATDYAATRPTRAALHATASTTPAARRHFSEQTASCASELVTVFPAAVHPGWSDIWGSRSAETAGRLIGQRDGVDMPAVIGLAAVGGAAVGIELRRVGIGAEAEVLDLRRPRPAAVAKRCSRRDRTSQWPARSAGLKKRIVFGSIATKRSTRSWPTS